MKIAAATLALCVLTPAVAQTILVPGNPPKGLECVRGVPGHRPGARAASATRDVFRECYEAPNAFVVIEKNAVGEGYSLSQDKLGELESRTCALLADPVRNCISILPGQERRYVEAATGLDMPGPETTFQWETTQEIDGVSFDIVTTIKFVFDGTELSVISVFTSPSN